ncbi:hypothetical protein Goari_004819 [Gossypium aridum]|uniref:Uncharacterized protein n=1 Tax=Gossypium aridum TaxID=34290 RepID=A0A7J8Y4N9_GOSAI|nr:hypothetical protein [Gossypium aridum]
MGQEITISVKSLSAYLSITNKGDKHYTGPYNTSLTRSNDYVSNDMDLYDRILYLIFTSIVAPTNKHSNFSNIDYWMWHCFRANHPLNFASIIFLTLIEIVRLLMSSNKTLRYNICLSHIFCTLRIKVSKLDRQSSVAQASMVPLVTSQTSNAPRSMYEAYLALLAPLSLCTACLL